MASSRVKATTTIVLSVIEDVLTLATTIVASSIAFSMRSIGFVLLKSPHVVPVFKRGAREREYAEIRDEEKRLLEKEKEEEEEDDSASLRRIEMEFAVPRAPTVVGKAREILFQEQNQEDAKQLEAKLVSEFAMSASVFYPADASSSSLENTVVLLNCTGGTQETWRASGVVERFCEKKNCSVLTLDMRGQGLETDIVDYDSLRVLAMDVLAVLRTVQEEKKRYKIGAKMHVVGYSIGAGVAMWIGVLLSPNRRGGERLTRPKVDSISLYGFTSKGVIAGRKNFIDRVLTQAFATEMFVRACGIRGFIGLMRLGIRPNYDALNAQKMNVDDLTHYTCDTNTLDGFAYQVKSWTTFELSRDEIKSIEIPTLILHCKGDERAGHKPEYKRADAETMPRGEFLQIQGDYSHLWPYENPEQFVRVVEEFQNRASARRL